MLCQTCQACFFQEELASLTALEWKPHQKSVEILEHGAREGCYVCYIVWNSLSFAYQSQLHAHPQPFVPTSYCICDNVELSRPLPPKFYVIDILCQIAVGRDVASRKFLIFPLEGLARL
jgi:hypothetical protein